MQELYHQQHCMRVDSTLRQLLICSEACTNSPSCEGYRGDTCFTMKMLESAMVEHGCWAVVFRISRLLDIFHHDRCNDIMLRRAAPQTSRPHMKKTRPPFIEVLHGKLCSKI